MATARRVLIVTTSHRTLGSTGRATGLWLEELAAPYWVLRDAGCSVDVVSIAGGAIPMDPRSLEGDRPASVQRMLDDQALARMLESTLALADVKPESYEAIFLPGGHGTMWDLPAHEHLARAVAQAYDDGRVVAAVCHGPAGLVGAVRADGKPLVGARRVTSFTNAEEAAVELGDYMPFLLESRLRELGGIFECAPPFHPLVVRDGNLVTGQNPQSSELVAREVLKALDAPHPDMLLATRRAGISAHPNA